MIKLVIVVSLSLVIFCAGLYIGEALTQRSQYRSFSCGPFVAI
jgi:hypothetical protein